MSDEEVWGDYVVPAPAKILLATREPDDITAGHEDELFGDGGMLPKPEVRPPKLPDGGDKATDRLTEGHEGDIPRLAGASH